MSSSRPTTTVICCTHHEPRIDSPEPPSRPLATTIAATTSNNLNSILATPTTTNAVATALLPEDHPDAPQLIDGLFRGGGTRKPPEPNASIIRSPSFAAKLRLQFRKRPSVVRKAAADDDELRKSEGYDEDAHFLTSTEVLREVVDGSSEDQRGIDPTVKKDDKMGKSNYNEDFLGDAVANGQFSGAISSDGLNLTLSALRSLEWLHPLIRSPSNPASTGQTANAAAEISGSHILDQVDPMSLVDLPSKFVMQGLRKAASSPDLRVLCRKKLKPPELRRTCSDTQTCHNWSPEEAQEHGDEELMPPTIFQRPAELDSGDIVDAQSTSCVNTGDPTKHGLKMINRPAELHLHTMDISKQLRSMSQMSDILEDGIRPLSPGVWTFHQRGRDDIETYRNIDQSFAKHVSGSSRDAGIRSPFPRIWSPTPSSIYSRNLSPSRVTLDITRNPTDVALEEVSEDPTHDPADDRPSESRVTREHLKGLSGEGSNPENVLVCHESSLIPSISNGCMNCDHTLPPKLDQVDGVVEPLSSSQPCISAGNISLPSTKQQSSKQKSFFGRLSQSAKAPQKRLSIFKLIRLRGRKRHTRSTSVPHLATQHTQTLATSDGTTDDPAFLSVEYEMEERPGFRTIRSASMNQLRPPVCAETTSTLTVPPALERRPTLADYERSLSVVGDDRRRPSTINLKTLEDIQEDDRRDLHGIRRRLSRARPLKDDANPLMASALEKHQEEKAMFRSASKQRDILTVTRPRGCSRRSRSHTESVLDSRKSEFEEIPIMGNGRQIVATVDSVENLRALRARDNSQPRSTAPGARESGPPASRRISTSLVSWSRYPSHTRSERCASAGQIDSVKPRDFAFDIDPDDVNNSIEGTATGSPPDRKTKSVSRTKTPLRKTRSLTFRGILRYYSNVFRAADFKGQNRRTSVNIGARVEHPELEMLPPSIPAEHSKPSHDPLGHLKEHFEDDMGKIKSHVKEGEEKVRAYAKKEKDHVKHFMHKEKSSHEISSNKDDPTRKDNLEKVSGDLSPNAMRRPLKTEDLHSDERFSTDSLFTTARAQSPHEDEASIGPNDEIPDFPSSEISRLQLDGTGNSGGDSEQKVLSKAETWSELYKLCVRHSSATDVVEGNRTIRLPSTATGVNTIMGPPSLKPLKTRASTPSLVIDSKVAIRRFPSVTVVDDRKGHWRSVSLISVGKGGSGGLQRESTNDLLELIKLQEQEEHDKIMGIQS